MARPPFEPTAEQRKQVEVAACYGMREDSIANALEISRPTLREHCADELRFGRDRRRLLHLMWLEESAEEGNVSARKEVQRLSSLSAAQADFENGTPPERPEKLGKKELQNEEAKTAGLNSEWGTDLMPSTPNQATH